jgi:RpiB/LacA/LacB family sugar-phosphate isomerase
LLTGSPDFPITRLLKEIRMRLVLGSDHAGYELKQELAQYLRALGHEVVDVGTHSAAPVDYPDYAEAVAAALRDGRAERGVLICGSGVGACVAANKIPGIRAGLCHDTYSAHQGVEHDDVNVLVVGSRVIGVELAKEVVRAYLHANFSGEERHLRRLGKVKAIEAQYLKPGR